MNRVAFCLQCRSGSRYASIDEPCATCGRKGVLAWEDPGQLGLFGPPPHEGEKREQEKGRRRRRGR